MLDCNVHPEGGVTPPDVVSVAIRLITRPSAAPAVSANESCVVDDARDSACDASIGALALKSPLGTRPVVHRTPDAAEIVMPSVPAAADAVAIK
jgi:hypothetical protein